MILSVLVLSSTVLALSAIGGYLMLVRLRVSSDIQSTTRAIYIADAGLECAVFNHFVKADGIDCQSVPYGTFVYGPGDDAAYTTEYVPGAASSTSYIRSVGGFRTSNRSFRMDF